MLNNRKFTYKLGLASIVASLLLWTVPFIAPFAGLSAKTLTSVIGAAVVVSEVLFWVGVLLVGREVAKKIRSYANPKNWRKEQPSAPGTENDREQPPR